MLKTIKCFYFIRFLFQYLNDENKLKLVRYNKSLQNQLGLNIYNYMIFSGKYVKIDENGKGKEFRSNDDSLLFEGEYVNGKRNGKGKEYNEDIELMFEGEYVNGKRNGKGKHYDYGGILLFEGEYLKGKRWNGKGYYNNKIAYELKNGNGIIKEFDEHDIMFEGEYKNGERNGKGKEYYYGDYLIFEGEYWRGKRWNGKGYDNNKKITYELKNGKGIVKRFDYNNILILEAEYINGVRNGKEKIYFWKNKTHCEVEYFEYINGKRNGKGKLLSIFDNFLSFEGIFLYDEKRKGKEFYQNGIVKFEGSFYLINHGVEKAMILMVN